MYVRSKDSNISYQLVVSSLIYLLFLRAETWTDPHSINEGIFSGHYNIAGAKVVMACRNVHMAEKVATEIGKETGGELVVMKLDLASLASIRTFAADLKVKETKIHMLINNAGW